MVDLFNREVRVSGEISGDFAFINVGIKQLSSNRLTLVLTPLRS